MHGACVARSYTTYSERVYLEPVLDAVVLVLKVIF